MKIDCTYSKTVCQCGEVLRVITQGAEEMLAAAATQAPAGATGRLVLEVNGEQKPTVVQDEDGFFVCPTCGTRCRLPEPVNLN